MAQSIKSKRISEQKNRFNSPTASFENKAWCIDALLGMRNLGVHNRRWCDRTIQKLQTDYANEMTPERSDLLARLEERSDLAKKKCETRIANKNAAKQPQPKAPATPAPPKEDFWSQL